MKPEEMTQLHKKIIEILEDKKACHIKLVDMQEKSDICSYQMICSGLNERHTQALCDAIEAGVKEAFGMKPLVTEGRPEGRWILLDYGSDIIHIFGQDVRSYFAFDALCDDKNILFESKS